ncbi:metabotropic glutamate receptor 3 isoform X3 [Ixodes scapularis]
MSDSRSPPGVPQGNLADAARRRCGRRGRKGTGQRESATLRAAPEARGLRRRVPSPLPTAAARRPPTDRRLQPCPVVDAGTDTNIGPDCKGMTLCPGGAVSIMSKIEGLPSEDMSTARSVNSEPRRGRTSAPVSGQVAQGRRVGATALAAALALLVWRLPGPARALPGKWPIQRMTNFSGDILLGALFPVHERNATYECGRIQDEGVQQLEALLYTLQKINNDSALLPGVTLGVLALDSCDSTAYALEQSLDFVKGFIARSSMGFSCADGSSPAYRSGAFDRVVGVIGGQSSAVSIQLANLLRLFRVPQVSYQSTSPTLSNKDKFGYFFRTVPSDVNQAHAILELLRAFRWTYVSVVYSDTDYGNKGYDKLQELAARYRICLSNPQSIPGDHFAEADYDAVLRSLTHKSNARVVVVFTDKRTARSLMRAAWRRRDRFVWIGSDAWSGLESVAQGHEEIVEGAITVSPMVQSLQGFDQYFNQLTPDNNVLDPWFPEYWEEKFQCRLPEFQMRGECSRVSKPHTGRNPAGVAVPLIARRFRVYEVRGAAARAFAPGGFASPQRRARSQRSQVPPLCMKVSLNPEKKKKKKKKKNTQSYGPWRLGGGVFDVQRTDVDLTVLTFTRGLIAVWYNLLK